MAKRQSKTEQERLLAYIREHKLVRARELEESGVTRTAIQRALAGGLIERIGRGLYQLPDADIGADASLAEIAKQAPNAVLCLVSALAFHGLTDQLPRKVWIAVGKDQWVPKINYPPVRIVRFREPYFSNGIETHSIGGIDLKVYSVAKTIADAFRNSSLIDRSVAIESLKSALELRKATPAEIMSAAAANRASRKVAPILEALTANG
ncbi:MAG: AbiEi antitoxin N-terminal domain-containing protein [Henriciella sp.]|nr:AbiEi antitoxin N-terminal domain-containing protein [Henriciella sp.]MBO6696712.1 AbiEi antitoxin N-terminal domain-containing protein [Henriciella sp.]